MDSTLSSKNISPSKCFLTKLLQGKDHQNCQAVFGSCEQKWIKDFRDVIPTLSYVRTHYKPGLYNYPMPDSTNSRSSILRIQASFQSYFQKYDKPRHLSSGQLGYLTGTPLMYKCRGLRPYHG